MRLEESCCEEESEGALDRVRDAYERAIANLPPADKKYWRRYVYLWINYALFEELVAKDAYFFSLDMTGVLEFPTLR